MGFGNFVKGFLESTVERVEKDMERYNRHYEYYSRLDKDSLKREYEKMQNSSNVDFQKKKALLTVCREKGYIKSNN